MKHFEIGYGIGNHTFVYKCNTVAEAFDALVDIFKHDPQAKKWEWGEYRKILLDIKSGKRTAYNECPVLIHYLNGEV